MKNVKTNKEMFVGLLSVIAMADITDDEKAAFTDFINGRIAQLDKKANTVSKADKEKAELNEKLSAIILDGLRTMDKPVKVSELIKGIEPLNSYSTQKITPILTKLVADGKVTKVNFKKDNLYSIA